MEIKEPGQLRDIETHQFFIDIMEELHQILSEGAAAQRLSRTTKPSPLQRTNSTLGKRKPSLTSLNGGEMKKAIKAAMPVSCAAAVYKPMSYAAAAAICVR